MPTDLTGDYTTFHETITVPEAGDDRKAASIVPAFQKLLDNSAHHEFRLGTYDQLGHNWSSEQKYLGELTLGDGVEIGYDTPPTRKVYLPLRPIFNLANYVDSQWLHADSNLQWAGADNAVHFVLVFGAEYVRTGSRIKAVRAAVNASVGVELNFTKFTYPTTPGSVAPGTAGTVYADSIAAGSTAEHLLEITCDELVQLDRHLFRVRVELNDDPPSFALRWVQLEFTDPGPRNY